MSKDWYKNAVLYSLDVRTYKDSNGDGIGDLQGVISKLDYLASLGVTCIWLLPFYPSPLYDNGYDVADYYNVAPELGTLGDFVELVKAADQKGIRILVDLVANHTSIEHPWFKSAKSSKDSPYRNYYVWTDEPPEGNEEKIMFEGIEDSIWEYTPETDSYYLHRFFKSQADLNIANPEVKKEILKIMGFWLSLGVAGFRVDAAHIITDPVDVEHINFSNLHEFFREMRAFMALHRPDGVLLGEANVPPEEFQKYFGKENNRMHMLFCFLNNKYTFLGFARKDGKSVEKGLDLIAHIHEGHWVNFVRHHDELNTELLNDEEREEVFDVFAPEPDMQIFGHGIRRRLPTMLYNDPKRIRLMYNIVFSQPGTPIINYGEEIGMGDDLDLEGRTAVRTIMQWEESPHAGFTLPTTSTLCKPLISGGDYSYKHINVQTQLSDPGSLLNWMVRLINARKQCPEIGLGSWKVVPVSDSRAFAICYAYEYRTLVVVHNLSEKPLEVTLDLGFVIDNGVDLFCDQNYDNVRGTNRVQLGGYGYRWMRILNYEL
jgi:maltose alpha-D-glucosyltransferase / alpha-amylase